MTGAGGVLEGGAGDFHRVDDAGFDDRRGLLAHSDPCRLDLQRALVLPQFLMQAGDHLADAGFAETHFRERVLSLQAFEPLLQVLQLLLDLTVFRRAADHN